MNMKKILLLLLTLALVLSIFASCNTSTDNEGTDDKNTPTDAPTDKPTEKPTEPVINNGTQNEILDNLLQSGEDIAIVDIEFDEEKLFGIAKRCHISL